MANRLRFFVPGNPQPKERPRLGKHGNTFTPKATRDYQKCVALHANTAIAQADYSIPDKAVPLLAILHFYRADYRRADADNLQKAILDALNGIAYADDSQIGAMVVTVTRGSGEKRAGVMVEVRPYIEEISILENLGCYPNA